MSSRHEIGVNLMDCSYSEFSEKKNYLQTFMIAQSLRFSRVTAILFTGLFFSDEDDLPVPLSSVTVILILPLWSDEAYLFNLLNIGDGLTRKSLKEEHILAARMGNFTANLPRA